MAVVQTNNDNQQKVSLPRRIATYITSMNFAKVFRRHHPKESSSSNRKSPEKSTILPHHHHQYARPFSYHIPTKEQLTPSSLMKTSNAVPYRIGLSSDNTLLNNGQTNETDEIVRLPIKNNRGSSPKSRKDRRHQSQLNANKRWLFRSMETLDGWKGKVFSPKTRPSNFNQSRSRSVENLADDDPDENISINHNPSLFKQRRAISPNRSIDAITNRVINAIGIHRESTQSVPNIARSPALTIEKQSLFTQSTNGKSRQLNINQGGYPSAILDFSELSALGFSYSRARLNDENETNSLTPSENMLNDIHLSDDDDENEEATSSLSFIPNGHNYNNNHGDNHEMGDSWDFSITWIDSLKEQHSPQRKIQFYENLIKLLEQDTLNIDELLVLRKVLSKIWPIEESTTTSNTDYHHQIFPTDSKSNSTKSLHTPHKLKQRSKLPTIAHHTAQRCSAIIGPPLVYEPLHEQNSGHPVGLPSGLLAAKAKPCFIENDSSNQEEQSTLERNYPQHLNPFDEQTDVRPSAPPSEDLKQDSNDSIRRYFERLTLLETIYEKLNIESNKTPVESTDHQQQQQKFATQENASQSNYPQEKRMQMEEDVPNRRSISSLNKTDTNKTASNKFLEMNVDGNSSIRSSKSSIKRRAPTAPHIPQNNNKPTMFTLSSADLNVPHRSDPEIHIPIQIQSSNGKSSTERITHGPAASCDDDGHIFVYDPHSNPSHEESSTTIPRKSDRIQQWLSSCETRAEELTAPHHISPKSQYKMRCIAKPIRHPSPSPPYHQEKNIPSPVNKEVEPARYRTSLKINLETNEPTNQRSRASSATSKSHQRQLPISNGDLNITNEEYFQRSSLSPTSFTRDHQAVFL